MPDGHAVLFSTKTDWAQILNPTGAIVWELCDGEHTVPQIAAEVSTLLGAANDADLVGNVETLIAELSQAGLLCDD